jgi:hypothetical protein
MDLYVDHSPKTMPVQYLSSRWKILMSVVLTIIARNCGTFWKGGNGYLSEKSNTLFILGLCCHQKYYSLNVGTLNLDFTSFDLLLVLI